MRNVQPALATLINSGTFQYAHLYTLTLFGSIGGVTALHLTDSPIDISWNGFTYTGKGVQIDQKANKRLAHWKRGLDVDQAVVVLAPRTTDPLTGAAFPDTIGSVPFLEAARGGALDGADVQIDRVFFSQWPTAAAAIAPTTVFTDPLAHGTDNGWQGWTDRQVFLPAGLGSMAGAQQVRFTILFLGLGSGLTTTDATIANAYTGMGSLTVAQDFDGTQVPVTFNGGNTSITFGGFAPDSNGNIHVVSDWITVPNLSQAARNLVYAMYMTGTAVGDPVDNTASSANVKNFYIHASDAATTVTSGYTANGNNLEFVTLVETRPASAFQFNKLTPAGGITIFAGTPAEVDTNDSMAVLTLNDYRQLLQNKFPRNHYQLGCTHTLFDAGCTLLANSFSVTSTIAPGSTRQNLITLTALQPHLSPGTGTFTLGKVTFTSGLNAGFSRTIRNWIAPNVLQLLNPFPFTVNVGDAVTVAEGCDKQLTTCQAFGNQINFDGDPFIPDATTAA